MLRTARCRVAFPPGSTSTRTARCFLGPAVCAPLILGSALVNRQGWRVAGTQRGRSLANVLFTSFICNDVQPICLGVFCGCAGQEKRVYPRPPARITACTGRFSRGIDVHSKISRKFFRQQCLGLASCLRKSFRSGHERRIKGSLRSSGSNSLAFTGRGP